MASAAAEDAALLTAAAREAGQLALRHSQGKPRTWNKTGGSIVSDADIAVEEHLTRFLRTARPDYGWRSEEEAQPVLPGSTPAFVVDPIDGTRDFLAGGREWTVALAVIENGRPRAGVVYAPALDQLYATSLGNGARRNDAKATVAAPATLVQARVAGPRRLTRAVLAGSGVDLDKIRSVPSLAHRLTLVAAGEVDVAIAGPHAHDWDLAAADLLVHEAGGVVTDLAGRAPVYGTPDNAHPILIAGREALVGEVIAAIRAFEARRGRGDEQGNRRQAGE